MSPQYDNFTFTCKLDRLWQQVYKWLFCRSLVFRKWSSSYRYWCTPIGFLNYNFTTSQFRDWKDAVKKACSHTLFRKLKAEGGSFPFLTCVGFATTVWSSRWSPVSRFNFQSKSALRLPVEDLLREHLPGLRVDLEAVLALVPDAVHDVVVHLVVGERPVLVNRIYPVE